MTGGYLIEADAYAGDELSWFWSDKGTPVTIKSPKADSITAQQSAYISQYYSKAEKSPTQYIDRSTFLRHFLVGEVSGNTDTYWSMYMYKHRGNDTVFVGPVWDFDLAFDNDNRTYPVNDHSRYVYQFGSVASEALRTMVTQMAVNDATGKQMLYAIWDEARRNGLTTENMLAYIDAQAQLLNQSQRLNFLRWPIMNQYVHQNPVVWGSYSAEVDNVKNYISNRITWMDKKLGYVYNDISTPTETNPSEQPVKVLQDGKLYIIRSGQKYSITGQKVQ